MLENRCRLRGPMRATNIASVRDARVVVEGRLPAAAGERSVRPSTHRAVQYAGAALALLLVGCSSKAEPAKPWLPTPSGQLPADYTPEVTRGILLARIVPVTDGQPGFGPITNPLFLQLQPADDPREVFTPFGADARVWTTESQRPSQWRYETPGLLAMSVAPNVYSGLLIAYPDPTHETATPSSIPEPSSQLTFAPLEIPPGKIVYIGDIELRQTISTVDWLLDKVDVAYAVHDEYDAAVAALRTRYPQLADVSVERRIAQPVTPP